MANVSLKGVYKYYDKSEKPAVSDFNLEIKDKEFIVFVGPSGCGKSTTLRMIAGLERISLGDVAIDGRRINNVEPKDRNIAMVFQNYALYPHMSVYKNMAYGLALARVPREKKDESGNIVTDGNGDPVYETKKYTKLGLMLSRIPIEKTESDGTPVKDALGHPVYEVKTKKDGSVKLNSFGEPVLKKRRYTKEEMAALIGKDKLDGNGEIVYKKRKYTKDEIKDKVMEAARILDIEQYLERKPSALSGGQRQRVAIGRSIVRNPKVFLFDEPLSNLDAKLRNQMRAEIIQLRKKVNTTFIYVTHDQVEAMTLGDRIVIMKDGFVQQVGTPTELFEHPANLFVAGFIGTPQMNFFDGTIKKIKNGFAVEVDGKVFPLKKSVSDYLEAQNTEGKSVVIGVRPEHITVSTEKSKSIVDHLAKTRGVVDFMDSRITVSEMMGSELYIHTAVGDKDVIVRTPTIALSKADRDNIAELGEMQFTFAPEVIHIFDKETSENLVPQDIDLVNE